MSEAIEMAIMEAEDKMGKALEVAREDMASIRTGRAHPAMFSKLLVDYYGAATPMQQLASFQVHDARTVLITPFDKGAMSGIEKALRESDLGLNPSNDGHAIRIVMPQLTEDRRKEYIKLARTKGEDAKVSVRNVRRATMDTISKAVKDGDIGEDEGTRSEKEIEALTKKFVDQVDEVLKLKEAELLEV
ncbi:ribosome recycling factor [Ornithinimicrobium ciconiae]|uniref:Ribosome-recycling factor n=1 Tax=Ornithinimicrobium ciconiae TaxID=2594265 RepID=A0A516GC89_9MICO|nr:ribosome recycling factor [Ornithinimicrobium ciconiae]QDO89128.1 ribosome recycling factor [Ornithinimicrobium ciconiae]